MDILHLVCPFRPCFFPTTWTTRRPGGLWSLGSGGSIARSSRPFGSGEEPLGSRTILQDADGVVLNAAGGYSTNTVHMAMVSGGASPSTPDLGAAILG